MNNPKKIYVHCTATREGVPYSVADIDRWHRDRGWCCIGYHRVVLLDGSDVPGRDPDGDGDVVEHVGAHVYGHNKDSLAVVYVGGVAADGRTPKDTRTPAQKAALLRRVRAWMATFDIPIQKVLGHYETDPNKACPSFNMDEFRRELIASGAPKLTLSDLPMVGGADLLGDIKRLQRALGVKDDGWIGQDTLEAVGKLYCAGQAH
jgi:N-acetylmuramoyl-L-alanine amidase